MKRGFMDLAVTIIQEYPGLSSSEVAKEALDFNSSLSDSKDPVQSLASTLNKQVQTGLEKRIFRKKVNGIYRYFSTKESIKDSVAETFIQLSLTKRELEDIDNLIAVGRFTNRNNSVKWLLMEGIKANRNYLDKVADTKNQIERLKREITLA
jgi:hypothetical protein